MENATGWQFWIDRGGTFTDVIGLAPSGELHIRKVLSVSRPGISSLTARSQPGAPSAADPGIRAAREILNSGPQTAGVDAVKVGTTVATNALLERKGEPVLLVTTAGFADGLRIGYQSRPDLFARHIVLADRLYPRVVEAQERIDPAGAILTTLDTSKLRADLSSARESGLRSVAIVFLHGWRYPQHEREAARIARELGFDEVSVSHELSPLIRYVARGDTTVLNAYLAPPLRRYVTGLQRELRNLDPQGRLELMQSNGGLAAVESFHAVSSVLSGPAGGLIGMGWIGRRLGIERLIGFDMGGTSTDVSLIDGDLPRRFEHIIAGVRLLQPMLDVHTIAAGGGSIVNFSDGRFAVGPASAGSDPGPACYGRAGPLTLTDVQVLLGRLRPDTLPSVFGRDGQSKIDVEVVAREFATLASRVEATTGQRPTPEALAASFLEVGVEAMANAIRQVSTRQGLDADDFTLFCFGGAAGQHACRVARAAGMRRILVHPLASVLSAFGIGVADRLAVQRASLQLQLADAALGAARERLAELEARAREELATFGVSAGSVRIEHSLEIRAGESETSLSVPMGPMDEVVAAFSAAHLRRFGFAATGLRMVIDAVRVEARMSSIDAGSLRLPQGCVQSQLPATVRAWFGTWREVPVLASGSLNEVVSGPALIVEPNSTLVLEEGWQVRRLPGGELLLETGVAAMATEGSAALPARIEIFNNLFMHIAEQMGEVLKSTAQSVNIKERLDYSCALFDAHGGLVANAPICRCTWGRWGRVCAR